MSPTQSTPPTISAVVYLRSWSYPNPLPLLFLLFAISFTPTPSLFSPSITPSHHHHLSVCLSDFSALVLFFYSLSTWFHLYASPSSQPSSLPPYILSFWTQSIHTSREKYRSDEHGEPGTNQSIDLSTYPSVCPSDRQQKTKCLLSETFPIFFYSHPAPLHSTIPPHLLMESLFLGPVHPTETCRGFQLHFFSKVAPVRVPKFCISSPSSIPCPPILPI